MAGKKIIIDVIVDDKGTTQRVAVSAKKLKQELKDVSTTAKGANKGLKGTAASAHDAEKAVKGTAQSSSNATKNFSKMSQGITGGLVPAYAVLAATVFAVGAAFRFLVEAGDLIQLGEGQAAYASATGIALKSMTNDIIAATDAQIKFADAAQAAAIGTAAGLSRDQLVGLGKAARDASLILGRDVTDAFNRLVRGVTKAEPELLDELGIILRLKDAQEKYALTLGKSAGDLSQFEKSQAVANEVLEQTEQKYSRVLAVADPQKNSFRQLAKSFDDLTNILKKLIFSALAPLASFLADNPWGLFVAGTFLAKSVLSSMGISFDQLSSTAIIKIRAIEQASADMVLQLKADKELLNDLTNPKLRSTNKDTAGQFKLDELELLKKAAKTDKKLGKNSLLTNDSIGFEKIRKGIALTRSELKSLRADAKAGVGSFVNLTKKAQLSWKTAFDNIIFADRVMQGSVTASWQKMALGAKIYAATIAGPIIAGYRKLQVVGVKTFTLIGKAMFKIIPIVGQILFAAELLGNILPDWVTKWAKALLGFNTPFEETAKEAGEAFQGVNKEMKTFLLTQRAMSTELNKNFKLTQQNIGAVGNLLGAYGEKSSLVALDQLNKKSAEFQKGTLDQSWVDKITNAAKAGFGKATVYASEYAKALKSDDTTAFLEGFQLQRDALVGLGLDQTKAGKDFTDFVATIEQGGPFVEKDFLRIRNAVQEIGAAANRLPELTKESISQVGTILQNLEFKTPFSAAISNLKLEILDLSTVVKALRTSGSDKSAAEERLVAAEKTIRNMIALNEKQFNIEKLKLGIEIDLERRAAKATPRQKQRLALDKQRLDIAQALVVEASKRDDIDRLAKEAGGSLTLEAQKALDISKLQTEQLELRLGLLEDEIDRTKQLQQTIRDALESSLSSGLNDLITNKNSSFKEFGANIATSILEGLAKTLSEQLTDDIIKFLDIGGDKNKPKEVNASTELVAAAAALKDFPAAVTKASASIISNTDALGNTLIDGLLEKGAAAAALLDKAAADGGTILKSTGNVLNQAAEALSTEVGHLATAIDKMSKPIIIDPVDTVNKKPNEKGTDKNSFELLMEEITNMSTGANSSGSSEVPDGVNPWPKFMDDLKSGIKQLEIEFDNGSKHADELGVIGEARLSKLSSSINDLATIGTQAQLNATDAQLALLDKVSESISNLGQDLNNLAITGAKSQLNTTDAQLALLDSTQALIEKTKTEFKDAYPESPRDPKYAVKTHEERVTSVRAKTAARDEVVVTGIKEAIEPLVAALNNYQTNVNNAPTASELINTEIEKTANEISNLTTRGAKALEQGLNESGKLLEKGATVQFQSLQELSNSITDTATILRKNKLEREETYYKENPEDRPKPPMIMDREPTVVTAVMDPTVAERQLATAEKQTEVDLTAATTAAKTAEAATEAILVANNAAENSADKQLKETEKTNKWLELYLSNGTVTTPTPAAPGIVKDAAHYEELTSQKPKAEIVDKDKALPKFSEALKGLFSGEGPFLTKMQTVFKSLPTSLQGIFTSFGGILTGLLAKVFGNSAGGQAAAAGTSALATGLIAAATKGANGGVMQGGFKAFANGGVVNKPTLGLLGEGRFNEAAVPLPDGKRIPVDLGKGSTKNENNVSISFVMSGDNSQGDKTQQADDSQLNNFGNLIADLIQRELADQSRPGGLLAK